MKRLNLQTVDRPQVDIECAGRVIHSMVNPVDFFDMVSNESQFMRGFTFIMDDGKVTLYCGTCTENNTNAVSKTCPQNIFTLLAHSYAIQPFNKLLEVILLQLYK